MPPARSAGTRLAERSSGYSSAKLNAGERSGGSAAASASLPNARSRSGRISERIARSGLAGSQAPLSIMLTFIAHEYHALPRSSGPGRVASRTSSTSAWPSSPLESVTEPQGLSIIQRLVS